MREVIKGWCADHTCCLPYDIAIVELLTVQDDREFSFVLGIGTKILTGQKNKTKRKGPSQELPSLWLLSQVVNV
jgi:hypothetical protein